MDRLFVLLAVLAATAAFSAWWRARDGRVRVGAALQAAPTASDTGETTDRWDGLPVEAADVATTVNPATDLVFVEFTAPDCQPCVATARVLQQVTADRDDVSITTLLVDDVMDLVRSHRVMRAPTTMLISRRGHLLGRVSGIPDADHLRRLLDAAGSPAPALQGR